MRVSRIDDGSWVVESDTPTQSGRRQRWSVKRMPHLPGGWLIFNFKDVQVSPTGSLGRKIIAAVERER